MNLCVACGDSNPDHLDHHHLVPRSCGGGDEETNLITLCRTCHGKLHGIEWRNDHSKLTREGQARAKARGIKLGRSSKLTDQQRHEVVRRLLEGESARAIGSSLDISYKVITRHAKSMGMTVKQGARKPGSWQLGHRNIQHTVRYTELSPDRFRDFWRE